MAPSAIEPIPSNYTFLKQEIGPVIHGESAGSEYGKALVKKGMRDRIALVDPLTCESGEEEAFFVADMGEVYRQHLRWKKNLKRVKPFYAVKCNPDPEVLRLLAALGSGFDCASKAEIDQVLELGVDPSRIIYAQPCKTYSHLRHAAKLGVKKMTFDNSDELHKIKELLPGAELFLRIITDDSGSAIRLSLKFGASLDCTEDLIKLAKELELNIVGVSFHVGSGASDPRSFARAVRDSRTVFDQAAAYGYNLKTLDVGGGFTSDALFENMTAALNEALDEHFPSTVQIIGEPGRYYVSDAFNVACNVIARRDVSNPVTNEVSYMLYMNDGVYGNFAGVLFDHQYPFPRILRTQNKRYGPAVKYSVWGPTCDSLDRITEQVVLPCVVDVGDWLYFERMGAYSNCCSTRFNGFTNDHKVYYVCSEAGASAILGY